MFTREKILEQIEYDWSGNIQSEICQTIFDYLINNNPHSLSYITYGSLKKVIGADYNIESFLKAIQYLCGERTHLLDLKFELIDGEESYPISNDEYNEAQKTGELVHPETGELVRRFEDKVYMFFQPSSVVKTLAVNNV